jgi:hypothetical protein
VMTQCGSVHCLDPVAVLQSVLMCLIVQYRQSFLLKQSVQLQFVKHVASSKSVPVILPDHFVTSTRSSVKQMAGNLGGAQFVSS